jgi:hypothetical protein
MPANTHARFRPFAIVCLVAAALALPGAEPVARISVSSTKPVLKSTLRDGVLINDNRRYTFVGVPKAFRGLQFTVQGHRKGGALHAIVTSGGDLFVALWDQASPAAMGLAGDWSPAGTIQVGSISTAPFTIYRAKVRKGDALELKPVDQWGAIVLARQIKGPATFDHTGGPATTEYSTLQFRIARHRKRSPELKAKLRREAVRPEALIQDQDATPTAVILRRSQALLDHLQRLHPGLDLSTETTALASLRTRLAESGASDSKALFGEACNLRRRVALRNPLLQGIPRILFLKHGKQARGSRHMIDQYLGFNAAIGGGVFVLDDPFGKSPKARDLLAGATVANGRIKGREIAGTGSFLSLDLSYEAREILFAWTEGVSALPKNPSYDDQFITPQEAKRLGSNAYYHYRPDNTYHIFRANVDGSNLHQLTDGRWNDIDPCFLPNDRIAFVSERTEGGIRCGSRPLVSGTLHAMMGDGSDIIALSRHDTNEWQPSVDHDGMLVYTRWDYVDRDSDIAHHIWQCFPDGRNPRSLHGNYPDVRETRPWMEMSIRAIPGSRRYVATAAPHHGEAYGSLVLIDVRQPDNRGMSQLKRLTPEYPFPEAESAPGVPHAANRGRHAPHAEHFGTAWPLNEDFYLCVFDQAQRNYALCLLDSFGNVVELYRDPAVACLDPMPLRSRPRPPIIPTETQQAKADRPDGPANRTAKLFIANAYTSELPWPEGTRLRELRIIGVYPKSNVFLDEPRVGVAPQSLARGVFGTVPIQSDGSVYCEVPTNVGIYFQVLDDKGVAVQTMRSITYAHDGELLSCIGCHEHKQQPPRTTRPALAQALRQPPARIQPEATGSYPLTFPRLVQPVLDARCIACHGKSKKAPSLRGDAFGRYGWSEAALSLRAFAWGKAGGNGVGLRYNRTSYSVPGKVGAQASKLYPMLAGGHHGLVLSPEELRRITLWLDANSCFYGAYRDPKDQALGQIVQPKTSFLPAWIR